MIKYRDLQNAIALVGGNLNNSSQVGSGYVNLNNAPSNANRNIGASLAYLTQSSKGQCSVLSSPLGGNGLASSQDELKALFSRQRNRVRG